MFTSMALSYAISQVAEVYSTETSTARTVDHDLESFCWVILYVAYRHIIDDAELRDKNTLLHTDISSEFARIFPPPASLKCLNTRELALSRSRLLNTGHPPSPRGIDILVDHYLVRSLPLAGLLLVVWGHLRKAAEIVAPGSAVHRMLVREDIEFENLELMSRGEPPLPLPDLGPPAPPIRRRHIALIGSLELTLRRCGAELNAPEPVLPSSTA